MKKFNLNEFIEKINIAKLPHFFKLYTYDDCRYNYNKNCGLIKLEFIYSQKNLEEPIWVNIHFKYTNYNNDFNLFEEIYDIDKYFVENLDIKANDLILYLEDLINEMIQ